MVYYSILNLTHDILIILHTHRIIK
jgi:hypothetical protein